jgi:hypothetical protein
VQDGYHGSVHDGTDTLYYAVAVYSEQNGAITSGIPVLNMLGWYSTSGKGEIGDLPICHVEDYGLPFQNGVPRGGPVGWNFAARTTSAVQSRRLPRKASRPGISSHDDECGRLGRPPAEARAAPPGCRCSSAILTARAAELADMRSMRHHGPIAGKSNNLEICLWWRSWLVVS